MRPRRHGPPLDVLVVDDSALMRRYLRQTLESAGHRVQTARDGADALRRLAGDPPDVVTLDINMPEMDGLTCLAHIMEETPLPVIMVSSLTEHGALASFEALELGAVDYIAKPGGTVSHNLDQIKERLLIKVAGAARARIRRKLDMPAPPPPPRPTPAALRPVRRVAGGPTSVELVVVGVSTGGPGTLETIFSALPPEFPAPIVVAQHMPENFTTIFAGRLGRFCPLNVVEVTDVEVLQPGTIYIARGGHDMVIERRLHRLVAVSTALDSRHIWHPSVSRLVATAMEAVPPERIVGVQLTGMGDDGARELAELKKRGGRTIAEAEQSCVVFGMPRALITRNGATVVLPREGIAQRLSLWSAPRTAAPPHPLRRLA